MFDGGLVYAADKLGNKVEGKYGEIDKRGSVRESMGTVGARGPAEGIGSGREEMEWLAGRERWKRAWVY